MAKVELTGGEQVQGTLPVANGGTGATSLTGLITAADINATGTPSSTTYHRGDGTWATPAGGSPPFSDATALVNNSSDATKQAQFSLANLTTGNNRLFYLPDVSNGLVDSEQWITTASSASYTMTSQTAAQKMFNGSTNGAVTVGVGLYFFETVFALGSLSSTSGTFSWGLGGTATGSGLQAFALAVKTTPAAGTPTAPLATMLASMGPTVLVAANTSTYGTAQITGAIRVYTAGTLIPQIALSVASAAATQTDSYFRIWQAANVNTVGSQGNWS